MTSVQRFNVIVLDDRSRFALHVWRYLSRSIGLGAGNPNRGEERFYESAPGPGRFETPNGEVVVWWVSTANPSSIGGSGLEGRILADLRTVLKEASDFRRRLF